MASVVLDEQLLLRALARRPLELPAAEHMHVDVVHRLAALRTCMY